MMIRLLYLIGDLGPGGAERQLCHLLQGLDRERYKPMVVVWNFSECDVHVPIIRSLNVPMRALPSIQSVAARLVALRLLIRKLKPEVVHSYSFYTNFAAKWAQVGLNTIPIGSIRNDFINDCRRSGRVNGRLSARWPRTQICNSMAAKRSVMECKGLFKPKSPYVVRGGLDIEKFRVNAQLPSQPTLLAIGRLCEQKRWDRLLRVMALASARGLAFRVRLAGDGQLRHQLEAQAKDLRLEGIIEFLGYRHDIQTLLAESTLLVQTSDHEGCPNVIMEAMACGRAVIATDAGDVQYLVEDGKTGFVVRRGDEKGLVDRMATLINNHELCRRMGEAGRAKAEREFSLDRLVGETLAAYRASGWRD